MYINILKDFNINKLINENYKIYAHIEGENKETLKMHIDLCIKYFEKIIIDKDLESVFLKFEDLFLKDKGKESKNLFREMLISIVTMHDIGKINPMFQKKKMNNNLNIKGNENIDDSKHSIYSSIIYLDYYLEKIMSLTKMKAINKEERKCLLAFLILNSYIISRHHSGFTSVTLDKYIEDILYMFDENSDFEKIDYIINSVYFRKHKIKLNYIKGIVDSYRSFLKEMKEGLDGIENSIAIYTYERIMLSCLIACDYYGTSEFMSNVEVSNIGKIDDINEFYKSYKDGEIYKLIRKYEKEHYGKDKDFSKVQNINILRNELFLDAEKELIKNKSKNIYYLEAPTGSGKSNVAMNLSFKLLEMDEKKNKIFYVYPFNTLIEQNISSINKIYSNNDEVLKKIAVINSLFPIKVEREEEFEDIEFKEYEKALLNRQFLNYPMILTTHVSIFRYMFGSRKEDIFPFHQLVNSVIVLDEIQSYKNKIWREIIEFLNTFSKILNIKIIIMSATLPNLDDLLKTESESVKLIKNRDKYFSNSIFKDRVKADYSLIHSESIFEDIIDVIRKYSGKKILIEFIKKSSAYSFFDELKLRKELREIKEDIRLLTGDDNSIEREKIINEIKDKKRKDGIILVATQVIEAGVDIDMNIGFKDISMLDSEEQFLGRINRSCSNEDDSIAYFFDLDDARSIYKEDVRKDEGVTLKNDEIKEILSNKEFSKYYMKINDKVINNTSKINELNTEMFFKDSVCKLNFGEIEKKMKLIDDDQNDIQIFLNYTIDKNGELICGDKVWGEYKTLLMDNYINYAEKMVKLSEIKAKMNYFIYRIRTKQNFNYNDRIGEILYIDNGEDFFNEGKLDKSKFENDIGEFI